MSVCLNYRLIPKEHEGARAGKKLLNVGADAFNVADTDIFRSVPLGVNVEVTSLSI